MDFLVKLFHTLFPLTQEKLNSFIVNDVGPGNFHLVIFAIIFCETGLVVTPFLPGDSLLFTLGAIGASDHPAFNLLPMCFLLLAAALCGDNVNYWLGRRLGPAIFRKHDPERPDHSTPAAGGPIDYQSPPLPKSLLTRLMNEKHLTKAQAFYDKYGAKTIILARFVPIVRTFAPFVAGIGRMNYLKFLTFSLIGALAWVAICVTAGYAFGNHPFVKKRFEVVIIAIVLISVLPMAIELLRARAHAKRSA